MYVGETIINSNHMIGEGEIEREREKDKTLT
jgi:hypothetical protein